MRSARLLGFVVVASLALSGCAFVEPSPTGSAEPPATSSEPEGQAQQRETGLVRPATVFDGRCDAVFSDAELQSVMGGTLALGANHFTDLWGGDGLFNQNGGFECTWRGEGSRVIALVLPEAAVEYTPEARECGGSHDTDNISCPMESVVNGIRLSGLATLGQDPAAAQEARDALVAIFAEKAATQVPVPVPLPAVGAWALPPDCAFSLIPGLGAAATGGDGYGYGKDTTQAERTLSENWLPAACVITGESVDLEFAPIGGGRWHEEAIARRVDATPLALDGVEAAYGVPYHEGLTLIYAFDGPNMLMFSVRFTKNAAGVATALIASLDSTSTS
jgi:hypothetical protein